MWQLIHMLLGNLCGAEVRAILNSERLFGTKKKAAEGSLIFRVVGKFLKQLENSKLGIT